MVKYAILELHKDIYMLKPLNNLANEKKKKKKVLNSIPQSKANNEVKRDQRVIQWTTKGVSTSLFITSI